MEILKVLCAGGLIYAGVCFTLHCLIVQPWKPKSHSTLNPRLFRRHS